MNRVKIRGFLASLTLVIGFHFSALPTIAAELILPPSLVIDGLSLDFPLPFLNQLNFKEELSSNLVFEPTSTLVITENSIPVIKGLWDEKKLFDEAAFLKDLPVTGKTALVEVKEIPDLELNSTSRGSWPEILESPGPTVIPTPTLKPTLKETSTPNAIATSTPSTNPKPVSGGLNAEKIFEMVNSHRASKGLPAFEKEERACSLAVARAPEVLAEINEGHMHSGMYGRKLPYFNTENIITMRTEEAAVNWWLNDYIHKVQIEGDYKYSCVACYGFACAQEFTSFIPKG